MKDGYYNRCDDCMDYGCAKCEREDKVRLCRACSDILPPSRYFNCVYCVVEMDSEDNEADHCEDVGF